MFKVSDIGIHKGEGKLATQPDGHDFCLSLRQLLLRDIIFETVWYLSGLIMHNLIN